MSSVRLVSWNLLADVEDLDDRMALAARAVQDADVLAVQESRFPEPGDDGMTSAQMLARQTGMHIAHEVPGMRGGSDHRLIGTAILTRLPVLDRFELRMRDGNVHTANEGHRGYAGAVLQMPSGRSLMVASVHLPWGGDQEPARLAHAQRLDALITERRDKWPTDTVSVMAGDFNTLPGSDTHRWLTGLSAASGNGAYWIDAWAQAGEGPGYTAGVHATNTGAVRTAKARGILDPSRIPARRIDFVMVRGWMYGKPGDPLAATVVGLEAGPDGLHASDHYGVAAQLWDPPRI